MNIPIGRESGFVFAMGHRVHLEQGGVPELKRRCLEALCHLDNPPDSVVFQPLWLAPAASESGERPAVAPASVAPPARAQGGRKGR